MASMMTVEPIHVEVLCLEPYAGASVLAHGIQ